MSTQDENAVKPDDAAQTDDAAECCPDCACHAAGPSRKAQSVACVLVAVAALAAVGQSVVKKRAASREKAQQASSYAAAQACLLTAPAQETCAVPCDGCPHAKSATGVKGSAASCGLCQHGKSAAGGEGSAASCDGCPHAKAATKVKAAGQAAAATEAKAPELAGTQDAGAPAKAPKAEGKPEAPAAVVCGPVIGSLAALNDAAADKAGVFVFLAGKDAAGARAALPQIERAAKALRAKDEDVGCYTLDSGCRDYGAIADQMSLPAVLVMRKGRGGSAVQGEITEAKLLQAFVAAGAGSSCCPSGSSGCK